ncbi:TPA: hypothetical protein ACUBFI_001903 [Escherichia coli]
MESNIKGLVAAGHEIEAKEIFFNYCNYSYHEIKDEEEEQNG